MTGRSSLPRRAADESTRPFRQGRFGFWFHPFARSLTMPHQRSRSTKQCCSPSLPRSAKIGRARDLNPGPHGPELGDVPSSNVGTIDFRSILLRRPPIPSRFETFSAGLLHHLLHSVAAEGSPSGSSAAYRDSPATP